MAGMTAELCTSLNSLIGVCTHHHPAVEDDAEGQVDGRDQQQSAEPLQQHGHQAHLEHVGVEHHQQDDDHVEQDADVLDAAGTEEEDGGRRKYRETFFN